MSNVKKDINEHVILEFQMASLDFKVTLAYLPACVPQAESQTVVFHTWGPIRCAYERRGRDKV